MIIDAFLLTVADISHALTNHSVVIYPELHIPAWRDSGVLLSNPERTGGFLLSESADYGIATFSAEQIHCKYVQWGGQKLRNNAHISAKTSANT